MTNPCVDIVTIPGSKETPPPYLVKGDGADGADWTAETVQRMRRGEGGGWFCLECEYGSKVRNLLVSHIESQHLTGFPGYRCALCGSHSTTYSGLEKHTSRQHSISLAKIKSAEKFLK